MRFVNCMNSECEVCFKGMPQKQINRKRPYIKYVRKKLPIFDPPPPPVYAMRAHRRKPPPPLRAYVVYVWPLTSFSDDLYERLQLFISDNIDQYCDWELSVWKYFLFKYYIFHMFIHPVPSASIYPYFAESPYL